MAFYKKKSNFNKYKILIRCFLLLNIDFRNYLFEEGRTEVILVKLCGMPMEK